MSDYYEICYGYVDEEETSLHNEVSQRALPMVTLLHIDLTSTLHSLNGLLETIPLGSH